MRTRNTGFYSRTRDHLIQAALEFCERVSGLEGVERIALIGSICTEKAEPKDVDLLVTIAPTVDMEKLATISRRLKGRVQNINCGADIFLADLDSKYIGRVCRWRECRPGIRVACEALHCGRVQYLYDDMQRLVIGRDQIANPVIILYPETVIRGPAPSDLVNQVRRHSGESDTRQTAS